MTTEAEFSTLRDELFRRVGRNLLDFQRIEGMLKFLVSKGRLHGPIKELAQIREAQENLIRQSTMGTLAGKLFDEFLADAGESEADIEGPITEIWVSFKVTIELDATSSAALREDLRALVEERNNLVHHLYDRWDGTTIDSTQATLLHLDEQRERVRPIFERLRDMTRNTAEGIKAHADFLASPEGERTLEHLWLCNSSIVRLLVDCSAHMARPDGWLSLSAVANVLNRELPEDVAALRERYGYSSLKKLMLGTDMFEVWDEPVPGGFRSVYRVKATEPAKHSDP